MAILIASGRSARGAHKGYHDILTPQFVLDEVVDLRKEGLGQAGILFDLGRRKECREEILRAIISGGRSACFEPWPPRDDALRRADHFLANEYILGIHPVQILRRDLAWNENPSGSTNWEFNFLALDVLANATEAYRQTGERKYLDKGVDLLLDFYSDNMDCNNLPSRYSWYDHSVAYRTIHMIDFWHEWLKLGEENERFVPVFFELIWRHGLYLERGKYYSRKTNHGIYANIAQLRLALAFPWFSEASQWKKAAIERMEAQISDNFTSGGIHKEYSPSYHILTTKLLARFAVDCASDQKTELSSSFSSLIDHARSNVAWLIHPDGRLSLIGDSSLETTKKIIGDMARDDPTLEWILTEGKSGTPPERRSIGFREAQLFVMRSGWGVERRLRDESYLIADFCPHGEAHQQDDYMAFEFTAHGVRWFTDLGVFNYNSKDAGRKFIISPRAHNLIVPFENTKPINRGRRDVPTRLDDSKENDQFEAMLDHIETIPEASARIGSLLQVRAKAGGRSESRILLMLALSYEELGNNSDKVKECLQGVIDGATGSGYYEIAVQLMDMLDVDVEDIEFDDSSDMEIHASGGEESGNKETEPVLVELKIGESSSGKRPVFKEDNNAGVVSSLHEVRPDHGQAPNVDFWIEDDEYDYLEGGYHYSKLFMHGRAILFVRPGILILVDRVRSTGDFSFSQFFHLPPVVTVEKSEDGYLLSGPDAARCIFSCVLAPEETKSRVIEGQRHPNLQGWYSGTFDNFEPAPVIEYSFETETRSSDYFVHVVIPVSSGDMKKTGFRTAGTENGSEWNPAGGDPLSLTFETAVETITVVLFPSSVFTGAGEPGSRERPRIEVSRIKR